MLGAREIAELLERHGLDARRSLGQNFVADPNTVVRIARLADVGPGEHVVEIGPGLGSLTLALVDTGARVLAVEKDAALVPVLHEVLAEHGAADVRVVEADALEVDWDELLGGAASWALVANLPYNVAVPIIMSVLERAPMVRRLVVMVQKEVAERLVASPGGRTVGIPSMRVAWYAEAELLGTVPPEVFVPRPRVTSALVGMTRREPPTRALGPDEVKYINSPETPLYVKGHTVYGLDLAKPAIRERNRAVVVEGYLDCLMAHQHGFTETVAALGTAFTPAQLALAWNVAQPGVTAAIAGSRNPDHVRSNAAAGDIVLDGATLSELDAIVSRTASG